MVQYWSKKLQYHTVYVLKMHVLPALTQHPQTFHTPHTQNIHKNICDYMQDMILHAILRTDVQLELIECVY